MQRPWTQRLLRACSAAVVIAGGVAPAAPARAGGGFTEEAVARGLDYAYDEFLMSARYGAGVAFVDLDNDGDPDVVLTGGTSGAVGIYENDGTGHFIDRTATSGVAAFPAGAGVTAADYDGDGDLDVHVNCWASVNALLRNDGGFAFTDVAADANVKGIPTDKGTGCAWADYDGDGDLDLYVSNRRWTGDPVTMTNHFYRNDGDGTFTDVAVALGVDDGNSPTFQAVFFDFDFDADPDLYLSTDKGYDPLEQNWLFENTGGVFTDISGPSGTAADINSMGVAVGDFSGNGFFDLYCTNTTFGNLLLTNLGDGTFVEPPNADVESNLIGWGAHFFDFDNDGWLELYACNEWGFTATPNSPNRLYDHDGSWPCIDKAPAMGVADPERSYCLATADIDDDGDLDLMVQDTDRLRLFVNHEGESRNHVKFDVVGDGANRFAVGATVAVRTGATWRYREVAAGANYKSQNHRRVHVGVNSASMIDEVVVTWPWGGSRTLTNLAADRTWTLLPDAHLGDADGDGAVTFDDYLVLRSCLDAPTFEPGCEVMDFDGNGAITLDDGAAFLGRYDDGPLLDCQGNVLFDLFEILAGTSLDDNDTGIPDECESAGDVNGDGRTDIDDVVAVITWWGPCVDPPVFCPGDTDASGGVDVDDVVRVILNWSE